MVAAPVADIACKNAFGSKRVRLAGIPWWKRHQRAFLSVKSAVTSFPILAFSTWDRPFSLHTDVSTAGAGAALIQEKMGPRPSYRFCPPQRVANGRTPRSYGTKVYGSVVGSSEFLSGRRFTLITGCSIRMRLFRSHDLDPSQYLKALHFTKVDAVKLPSEIAPQTRLCYYSQ